MAIKRGAAIAIAAGAGALIFLATRGKAAPPEPPLGLANLYGKVTDAGTGKAVPGVRVTLDGLETQTDANGNYVLADLEPGGYRAEFSKAGYETAVF